MTFLSWGYVLFFGAVFCLYWLLPHRFRMPLLLAASVCFCSFFGLGCVLWLAGAVTVSYIAALAVQKFRESRPKAAKAVLAGSLSAFLGSLFLLKYADYILSAAGIADISFFSSLMPVGISFYMFQVSGYVIDVYRGRVKPVKNFARYALSVSFFAKFIQGPIQPVSAFIPQIDEKRTFELSRIRYSAVLALLGIFKKAVIADRIAPTVNSVFDAVAAGEQISTIAAVGGVILYAFQLYADFSGYTDIALGCAGMLGFELVPNFRQPYLSKSIAEFWRRWHISLSTWLREYLYFPLGGSRVSQARWALNVAVVFLVSGLWHGTGAGFIIWGLLHAFYQITGKLTAPARKQLKSKLPSKLTPAADALSVIINFTLVCFAWIFFRAASVGDALAVIGAVFRFDMAAALPAEYSDRLDILFCFAASAVLIIIDIISERCDLVKWVEARPVLLRWVIYLLMLFAVILLGSYGSVSEASFIYAGF